jgi:type IV pilus assembly protein PilM
MAKKLNNVLGVDIGSQYIKIAEMRLAGRQATITALGMAATPEGAVDHMGVHDGAAVSAVLKQLCAASGVSVGDAVVSLSGQSSVLVRTLEVPKMNDDELKKHMDWEITRNIPFAESTVVSDFKAYAADNGAQNMDVVMAIAPQSAVDSLVDLVKKSGKKAAAFDVEPLGLARVFSVGYETRLSGKTVCIVEMGHKTTAINMYKDGQLLMPRQVPIGGEILTRAISEGMSVAMDEAEQLKTSKVEIPDSAAAGGGAAPAAGGDFAPYNPFADSGDGSEEAPAEESAAPAPVPDDAPAGDPEAMRLYNSIASVMDEITAEVRRSVDYFRSKGGDVHQVLLCGGAAKLKGLPEFLRAQLGISTELMDPFTGVQVKAKKADPAMIEESKQDFAVVVGNGLHILF